jgi:hypothetical protein
MTEVPAFTWVSSAKALGIRSARLFPQRWTVAFILCIYFGYPEVVKCGAEAAQPEISHRKPQPVAHRDPKKKHKFYNKLLDKYIGILNCTVLGQWKGLKSVAIGHSRPAGPRLGLAAPRVKFRSALPTGKRVFDGKGARPEHRWVLAGVFPCVCPS